MPCEYASMAMVKSPARKDALPAVRARSAVPRAARAGAKSNARVTTRSMWALTFRSRDSRSIAKVLEGRSAVRSALRREPAATKINTRKKFNTRLLFLSVRGRRVEAVLC